MLFTLIAALAAEPAHALPPDATPPGWLKTPNAQQMLEALPVYALRQGIRGKVQMDCLVSPQGLLEDCKILMESPPGHDLGAAALHLAPRFQFTPASTPNGPIATRIDIPVDFNTNGTGWGGPHSTAGVFTLERPVWIKAPTFDDMAAVYPPGAGGVDGKVLMRCELLRTGAFDTCEVLREEPPGKGFSSAARSLAPRFAVRADSSWLMNNGRTWVDLPISFVAPDGGSFKARKIVEPLGTAAVDPGRVAEQFPAEAAGKGLTSGQGVAECIVDKEGALRSCRPLPGTPDGVGFSESAVRVASVMRISPWTAQGGPVDGATVQVPIQFTRGQPSILQAGLPRSWKARPSGQDVARVIPSLARRRHLSGRVVMVCGVEPDGHLENCAITEEDPPLIGFGEAALKLAPTFRMTASTDPVQTPPPTVRIPIRFVIQ